MVRLEAAEDDLRAARAGLDKLGTRLDESIVSWLRKGISCHGNWQNLRDERSAALSAVAAEHLQTYERHFATASRSGRGRNLRERLPRLWNRSDRGAATERTSYHPARLLSLLRPHSVRRLVAAT